MASDDELRLFLLLSLIAAISMGLGAYRFTAMLSATAAP
jgi:hypothetical protein